MDRSTAAKISRFWNQAGRSRPAKGVFFAVVREFLRAKRLPVRGWFRSAVRSSRYKVGWWNHPCVIRKLNELVCGQPVDGRDEGIICRLRQLHEDLLPLARAVSVGCGDGSKELSLLQKGIAGRFDLFELSDRRIAQGIAKAERAGLSDRMNFTNGNAFELVDRPDRYDLVVWFDALHHMPDVEQAMAWTRKVLRRGGIVLLSEFVGPSRFQWSDRSLRMARAVREALNPQFLAERNMPFSHPSAEVRRPTVEEMIARDPSEAWDSSSILPSLEEYFPEAHVFLTGGVVYFLALHSCIHNLHPQRNKDILELLLLCDRMCIDAGESLYAAAIGRKT